MRDSRCTEGAHYGCSCDDSELRDLRAAIAEWGEEADKIPLDQNVDATRYVELTKRVRALAGRDDD